MTTSKLQATAVHSNAFNFKSFVQSGVDSRTGLYTVSLSFPEIKTCDLSGPALPLNLNYSPTNTTNNGFGTGWRLALTQYATETQIISVHSGESFKVTGNYSDEGDPSRLRMKEQKIQSFRLYQLTNDPRGHYKVVHASGLVEILKLTGNAPQVAVPVKMYSPQGHEVSLLYGSSGEGRMLSSIRDSQGLLLEVLRNTNKSTVDLFVKPVNGVPSAVFTLHLEGDRMTRLSLPTSNKAGWRFLYGLERDQLCIKEVWTPTGGYEQIQYNDAGHGFPGNPGFPNLPRVTDHITTPGAGQPPIRKKYTYSSNNFLGYNSTIDWENDGQDNLYKVIGAYLYEVTESLMVAGNAVRTVHRSFNRFHLTTSEITSQGNCRKSVKTTYYANDRDPFDKQDRRCQLPRQITTLWHVDGDPRSWRQDKEISEFDIHGNQTLSIRANGITEISTFYPAEGVPGECPPDPYGFVRHLREKTVNPASDPALVPDLQPGAAALRTRFRYEAMSGISGSSIKWVTLVEQRLLEVNGSSEQPLERMVFTYFNEPANHVLHGRHKRKAVTVGEGPGYTSFTDYTYSKQSATYATFAGETVLRTEETLTTDFDDVRKSVTQERSLLTDEPLLVSDKDELLRYLYDPLGRVISETEAWGTDYPATRKFSYRLVRPAGPGESPETELASQEMEDVKKVKIRTLFDGLGRAIREQQQDVDNAGTNPAEFRDVYEAEYDELSQLRRETMIDWLEKVDLPLTTTYTYDLWGLQDSATGPDGIKHHTRNNLLAFTTEKWVEGMGRSVTVVNRFDKPVKTEQYDLNGRRVSAHRYKYDGQQNCVEEIDALGRTTLHRYDIFSRLSSSTLPDKTVISHTYAPHSVKALPTALMVKPGNAMLPSRTVGEQRFDGLERLRQLTVGKRVEHLHYEAGRLQPSRRVTAAGENIDYEYKPGLTTQPTAIKPPEGDSTFGYDLLNGNLETSSNDQGTYSFTYTGAGHLSVESWKEPANPVPWVTRYTSSLQGRQLSRTDVGGEVTQAEYDKVNGRLISVRQCQLQGNFDYDTCGRLYRTKSTDLGSGNNLTTTLTFDDLGREIKRVLALQDAMGIALAPERSVELTYLADGNINTRQLQVDGKTALLETFSYDLRGRLELHKCAGSDLPKDRFGNAIVKQYFEFEALDNIIYTRTDFDDGTRDIAEFGFSADDPCQLISATHSHVDYLGLVKDFTYDPDGNLEHDERGQKLHYDSQGRLTGVDTAAGQPVTTYRYDAHDHLVAFKRGGEPESLRFYEGNRLSDTVQDGEHIQVFNGPGPLGQQTPGDDTKTLLLLTDIKNSVIAESQGTDLRSAVYSAYGERSSAEALKSLLAFNGEVLDPESGWYLLGRGYRAYNPCLMRFHSPDSLSPFGPGGINCYTYCSGNPIAFSDPTGHESSNFITTPAVQYSVMGVSTFLGILISILTLNPVPLALSAGIVASAAGAATATVMNVFNGVLAATAVYNLAAIPTFFGFTGTSMSAKDAKTHQALAWVGFAVDWLSLPAFKAVIRPAPMFGSARIMTMSNFPTTPIEETAEATQPIPLRKSSLSSSSGSTRSISSASSNARLNIEAAKARYMQNIDEMVFDNHIQNTEEIAYNQANLPASTWKDVSVTANASTTVQEGGVLPGPDYFKGRQSSHKPKVIPPMAPAKR